MKQLRYLPAIDFLKSDNRFTDKLKMNYLSDSMLTDILVEQVDKVRNEIINKRIEDESLTREELVTIIFNRFDRAIADFNQNNLQRVVNATGVVLHTNLGRAPLSEQAITQLTEIAKGYSTLEYNIRTGKRGSRHDIVEQYLTKLTGAEAAMVVNNNAAAVYLILKAIASGKEAIVSRGELVEIGGSFRVSDIMEESNVDIVEVGTTNKTKITDYERAITDETSLLLKVHKSNFKIIGFTEEVDTEALVSLSKTYNIPIYEDLGSGTLFNFTEKKIGNEPTVQQKVKAGIHIISFSGDKLLGGPQAGIIVGRKKYIDQLKKHQLARVLRVDKFTLATLEATLKTYLNKREREQIPVIRNLLKSAETIKEEAHKFIDKIVHKTPLFTYEVMNEKSKVGGGTMPEVELDTYVIKIIHDHLTSEQIAKLLRHYEIPVIVRIKDEAVLLDFRTVNEDELDIVVNAFLSVHE